MKKFNLIYLLVICFFIASCSEDEPGGGFIILGAPDCAIGHLRFNPKEDCVDPNPTVFEMDDEPEIHQNIFSYHLRIINGSELVCGDLWYFTEDSGPDSIYTYLRDTTFNANVLIPVDNMIKFRLIMRDQKDCSYEQTFVREI